MQSLTGTLYDAEKKIWSGPRIKDLYHNDMTVGEVILMQLQKSPQKVIQISDTTGETLMANEFLNYSMILANNLLKMGIKPGDIVGLCGQNSKHVATLMMASFLCGTPVNPLYPGFDKDNIKLLYANTRPKLIYCDVENYDNLHKANEELNLNAKIVLLNGSMEGVLSIQNLLLPKDEGKLLNALEFPCVNLNSSDTAVILCSSGTTGTPKGVMISHHALLHKNVYLSITYNSVVFCFSTMYWASGVLNLVTSLLNCTLRIVTEKPYSPEYFLYLVKHYKITHVLGSGNQMAEMLLKHSEEEIRQSLQNIDSLLCGGSKVPQPVQEKLLNIMSDNKQRPGFCNVYGMSEICGAVSYNAGHPFEFQAQSEGKLAANIQVCIIDKKGERQGPNVSGELLFNTPYTWKGYYNNAETTAKAFSGKWLHSGDVGYFDDLGFLHINGRVKDMFKSKNFQIYPQLIEDVILRLAGVAEVCVFPVPDYMVENLAACAIVRTQCEKGGQLTLHEVDEYVKNNLDDLYHLKGGLYFVDVIPKTSSGKMQRQLLAEMIIKTKN